MMRRIIIAGNWKMNKTYSESEEFLSEMADFTETKDLKNVDVVICTPALYMKLATGFAAKSKMFIGAQNVSNFDFGAYTGEDGGCNSTFSGKIQKTYNRRTAYNSSSADSSGSADSDNADSSFIHSI